MSYRKIGLLGGTFDPVHLTHLHMAEVARDECNLDEVWFVPANVPPHKQDRPVTPGEERIEMLKLAIEHIPYFKLSLVEFERKGPSFTIDTIKELRRIHPHCCFSFIIGGDMVENLPEWHQIEELVKLVRFIGIRRPESRSNPGAEWENYVDFVDMVPSYVSSSLIRERRQQGKSIRFLVPEPVYQYIERQGLYQPEDRHSSG
ncbi:nicotinate-nucleotide adenylyltransferase [Caldalkalibacillus uzonensis]|uniref:Probable nicotinate-nucleotide adenylyltransferase n=1 Tax=Caldalkalibacillus uzonensis TaxID=353224 RepID=A0ABU0CT79_9BACI|nr:nicotinate-nucleotide adenylyltransferase [Caldalkalibacillus uzonensis]MDQ0339590.1 nicotinate-nucleotide adenylyltransferase [Caldalkalibacillus uzonensis]